MRVIEHLAAAVRRAAVYNPDVQAAPHCILWPDADRQWEPLLPRLRLALPELLTLGDYAPDERRGPAIWLRCAIAGLVREFDAQGQTPILYLPGVSRQELRAVDACPAALKPLAELQYRGVIWSQVNAKDWTVLAYLKSAQGGLGLDVAQDADSLAAMHRALPYLLEKNLDELRGSHWDADALNALIVTDSVRDLLRWIDDPDAFRASAGDDEWQTFLAVAASKYGLAPEADGPISAAARLARHEGAWEAVWARFCEAPALYPHIPDRIRQCAMPDPPLYATAETFGSWPQWNDRQEQHLRSDLAAFSALPPHEARVRLRDLEEQHAGRRRLVWAQLGQSSLAALLEHLATLAEVTATPLAATTAAELGDAYRQAGWRADDAFLRALAAPVPGADADMVLTLARQLYEPWATEAALRLQQAVVEKGYPGGTIYNSPEAAFAEGEAVLFVDALRLDVAHRLADYLQRRGLTVSRRPYWAAIPSVTATAKPAITPVRDRIRGGKEFNADFEPSVEATGQVLNSHQLKKLLADAGWQTEPDSLFAQARNGWFEIGDLDSAGHEQGWKLARRVDDLVSEVADRVGQLLDAGWSCVRVITDHGWLLLPGGLPKADLHSTLTYNRWGRCAAIKPGALADVTQYPWYWNPHQTFALAEGICCFVAGSEYAHGGLSLQECALEELVVRTGSTDRPTIQSVVWKGLTCRVAVTGEGVQRVDVRTHPNNPQTSIAVAPKPLKQGSATLIVEDEDLSGEQATIVLLDAGGKLVAQQLTTIGGADR